MKTLKRLSISMQRSSGRNFQGRITSYHRGAGASNRKKLIDYCREVREVPGIIRKIERSYYNSSTIFLICYYNGIVSYVLGVLGLGVGDIIISGAEVPIKKGNATILKNIPVGTLINNVEVFKGRGGQLSRSAGSYSQLLKKAVNYVVLKLRSGEHKIVSSKNYGTIGLVANSEHQLERISKAGRSRKLGIKPKVRGVAKNPVDHPHGGGEGKSSGGRVSVTPWGIYTKGKKTKKKRIYNKFVLKKR